MSSERSSPVPEVQPRYKILCCRNLCHEILPNWLDSPLNVGILVAWYESINQQKQEQWCGKMKFSFITWRSRYCATIVPFGATGTHVVHTDTRRLTDTTTLARGISLISSGNTRRLAGCAH